MNQPTPTPEDFRRAQGTLTNGQAAACLCFSASHICRLRNGKYPAKAWMIDMLDRALKPDECSAARRFTEEEDEAIRQGLAKGETFQLVADQLNRARSSVWRRAKILGVEK